jgi:hypothetical protein
VRMRREGRQKIRVEPLGKGRKLDPPAIEWLSRNDEMSVRPALVRHKQNIWQTNNNAPEKAAKDSRCQSPFGFVLFVPLFGNFSDIQGMVFYTAFMIYRTTAKGIMVL